MEIEDEDEDEDFNAPDYDDSEMFSNDDHSSRKKLTPLSKTIQL